MLLLKLISKKLQKNFAEGFSEKTKYASALSMDKSCFVRPTRFADETADNSIEYFEQVARIVCVTCTRSNTSVSLMDTDGSVLKQLSSGDVGLSGKLKINRTAAIRLLAEKLSNTERDECFLKPVAIHLNNAGPKKGAIMKILTEYFVVAQTKFYDKLPYNGCRKKKLRRKRFVGRTVVV